MPFTSPLRFAAMAATLVTLTACGHATPLSAAAGDESPRYQVAAATSASDKPVPVPGRIQVPMVVQFDGVEVGTLAHIAGLGALSSGDKGGDEPAAGQRKGGKIITDRDSGRARIITTSKDNDTGTLSGRMAFSLPADSRLANAFAKWRKRVLAGTTDRKSMSVVFSNDAGEERRLTFYGTFPVKWAGPALNARNSGHAVERLEVVFERLELK